MLDLHDVSKVTCLIRLDYFEIQGFTVGDVRRDVLDCLGYALPAVHRGAQWVRHGDIVTVRPHSLERFGVALDQRVGPLTPPVEYLIEVVHGQ